MGDAQLNNMISRLLGPCIPMSPSEAGGAHCNCGGTIKYSIYKSTCDRLDELWHSKQASLLFFLLLLLLLLLLIRLFYSYTDSRFIGLPHRSSHIAHYYYTTTLLLYFHQTGTLPHSKLPTVSTPVSLPHYSIHYSIHYYIHSPHYSAPPPPHPSPPFPPSFLLHRTSRMVTNCQHWNAPSSSFQLSSKSES